MHRVLAGNYICAEQGGFKILSPKFDFLKMSFAVSKVEITLQETNHHYSSGAQASMWTCHP